MHVNHGFSTLLSTAGDCISDWGESATEAGSN